MAFEAIGSVGEVAAGVLGVVVAGQRALLDLGLGLGDRLAHLRGDQPGVLLLAGAQYPGQLAQQPYPLGDSRVRQRAWAPAAASSR